ncbi:hypothetical protein [Bosea sp. (in: a-proteobacteria)]
MSFTQDHASRMDGVKLAVFVGLLWVAAGAAEIYARFSPQFASGHAWYIGHLLDSHKPNAVFGDSQVGGSSYLQDTDFFGIAGQQPQEFERVVRFVFAHRKPGNVIVMASPQWFGAYHADRQQVLVDSAFPPAWLPLRIASGIYRSGLKAAIVSDVLTGTSTLGHHLRIVAANAAELSPPDRAEVLRLSRLWEQALASSGKGYNFPWADFPAEYRGVLTLSRVFEQNPVPGFETGEAAHAYLRALQFLKDHGARLCLVRTPVTRRFLTYSKIIPGENYTAFDRYIRAISNDIDAPFFDQNGISLSFDDDIFVNQDHLSYDGHAAYWPLVREKCFRT